LVIAALKCGIKTWAWGRRRQREWRLRWELVFMQRCIIFCHFVPLYVCRIQLC